LKLNKKSGNPAVSPFASPLYCLFTIAAETVAGVGVIAHGATAFRSILSIP
jgi:hypothetical protein